MLERAAIWVGFNALILALLAVDLGMLRRRPAEVAPAQSARWTLFWIAVSLGIGAGVWHLEGRPRAVEFFTAYVIEYALSVDNLFVFLLVFTAMGVEPRLRHRVLFWGILGAFAMRATLIIAGVALVHVFRELMVAFGALLLLAAFRLWWVKEEDDADPNQSWLLRTLRARLPLASAPSDRFLVREAGRWVATPLLLVLVSVEVADVMFAFDSIPAVLGVSDDAFVVYSSNVCAILGLRSLFFLLSAAMTQLRFLKFGLSAVLGFVGAKMLLSPWWQVSTSISLAVVAGVFVVTALASWIAGRGASAENPL